MICEGCGWVGQRVRTQRLDPSLPGSKHASDLSAFPSDLSAFPSDLSPFSPPVSIHLHCLTHGGTVAHWKMGI